MKRTLRIFVELLAPPFLAALWLLIFSPGGSETLSDYVIGGTVLMMFSYIFGIIPAGIYMFAMELWFRLGLHIRYGLICTAGLSSLLGAVAGFLSAGIGALLGFLIPMDCPHFALIGAVIGLLIGVCVGWRQEAAA